MTVLPRGGRPRRGGRRPGWLLLTVLLVLAILASSALVFTDRVELLKLAVILALWAAVVAAFVSVIYRRQSDLDQAKARDLKFVYDLQLDREISARREYELTVETQLRRELASELRAQAADEVAALRSELAALRANLEILFDTDLVHRPALETDKSAPRTAGRVTASRLDVPPVEVTDTDIRMTRTEESPIIDVPAEPHPPENDWATAGGAHRLPSRPVPAGEQPRRRRRQAEPSRQEPPRQQEPKPQPRPEPRPEPPLPPPPRPEARPEPEPQPQVRPEQPAAHRQPEPASTWAPPPPPPTMPPMQPSPTIEAPEPEPRSAPAPAAEPAAAGWQPAPAEGQWIPAGAPGSNWSAPVAQNGATTEYVGRRRAPEPDAAPTPESTPVPEPTPTPTPAPTPAPAMSPSQAPEPPRGRHSAAADPGRPTPAQPTPALATESSQPPEPPRRASRHRSDAEPEPQNGHHADGQSVNELLARFQAGRSEGGRRRRREE